MEFDDPLDGLRSDIAELASFLLPRREPREDSSDDPLAAEPGPGESLRIRAFLILSHAGIEEAIEDTFSQSVDISLSQRNSPPPAVALSLTSKYADDLVGQNGGKVPSPLWILDRLPGLYKSKVVKPNNGIRRSSIEALCKPLGIDTSTLDDLAPNAIAALDTLGAKRGAAAHTLRGAAKETIHAADAEGWVTAALTGLDRLLPVLREAIGQKDITVATPA